ncbi:hypothetical protein ADO04_00721 [Streptococcus parauberis]|nr:hypothetical protein AKL14_01739 [Streptococcus parauberis]KYP24441.1 hypothetical protein ADO04_00721 [Streptococcus parauberis]KYP30866.1 hypothetical protein ADO03_00375 [Streptococcus parauberis]
MFVSTLFFGMSGGAAVLYDATPNYLKNRVAKSYKNLVLDIVPLTESVLNLPFISFFCGMHGDSYLLCLFCSSKGEQ